MPTIDEKRVFEAKEGATRALVASGVGVVAASVSGDIVGEFEVVNRCTARDLAVAGDALAVATDEDVLVGAFEPTDHGPAVAVGLRDGDVLAAAPDGTVSRLAGGAGPDGAWEPIGSVEDPRRIDGPLVAAAEGVYRLADGGLSYAGLTDARDVAGRGVPLAATADGLYELGNGWLDVRAGDFRAVATDADGRRAVAATADALFERPTPGAAWIDHPEVGAVDVAASPDLLVAVTEGGELRVLAGGSSVGASGVGDADDAGGGDGGTDPGRNGTWRGRTLGVPEPAAVALPGGGEDPLPRSE